MKKIDRSWWETNAYDIDIEDVIARVAQVAKKQDEIVRWINEQNNNVKRSTK